MQVKGLHAREMKETGLLPMSSDLPKSLLQTECDTRSIF